MSKKLRLAIVGTGSRGVGCFGKYLPLRNDVEITALCDVNPVRLQGAAKALNISPHLYTSMEEMAQKETLEGVIITVPDCDHCKCALTALHHNWNVLIDKPLATNVKDCLEVIRTAEKSGKTVMIGFNLRHHAVLKRLKEIIDEGTLGKVFLAENREFYDGGRTYMSRWNRLFAKTGGLWIHKASHDFDIFNWLLGFPKPVRVASFAAVNVLTPEGIPFPLELGHKPGPDCTNCYYNKVCPDWYSIEKSENPFLWNDEAAAVDGYVKNRCMYTSDKDTHDNGLAIVEYEGDIKISLFETFIGSRTDRLYTIVGDRGMAEVSLDNRTIAITPRWGGDVVTYTLPREEGSHGGADLDLIDTFCTALKGGISSISTAEEGLYATALGQAAETSRRQHRTVEINELFQETK